MAAVLVLSLLAAGVLVVQCARALGRTAGTVVALVVAVILGGGWWVVGRAVSGDGRPEDWSTVASVSSDTCARCHPDHYETWRRTYHRTMTREASAGSIQGDFDDARYDCQGVTTRLTREGDGFFMETIHPTSALLRARAATQGEPLPPPRYGRFRVERVVGSHWIQEYLLADANGRYSRLPVLYHLGERRWIQSNGAFLVPETPDFWHQCRGAAWNDTCLYCHNTGPSKNPVHGPRGEVLAYQTDVAELGISCEACHGPAGDHVRLNRNPARRLDLQHSAAGDPSIVNPARLSVPRRDEVCARCHGALVPRPETWDPRTHRDPFLPGQELTRFNHVFWSEAEQADLSGRAPHLGPAGTRPPDGRFWGDGTPLTTALEYNGMALSACYQKGRGTLSCLSCHTLHGDDPNFMLKPGMQTNEACLQCHADFRARLTEHTGHAAGSPGSLCFSCHMPRVVYSLMTTHRSHRIDVPDVADSLATGKPHACNLCHLDKSLGWTQEQLLRRPGWRKPKVDLPAEQTAMSSALLMLMRGDARSRVMVAGAFSDPAAQAAAGADWFSPFLVRVLEHERYPAVRYLAHRSLRSVSGEEAAGPYDFLGLPGERAAQLAALRHRHDATSIRRSLPHLPLTSAGRPDDAVLRRLLAERHDPDLSINE